VRFILKPDVLLHFTQRHCLCQHEDSTMMALPGVSKHAGKDSVYLMCVLVIA